MLPLTSHRRLQVQDCVSVFCLAQLQFKIWLNLTVCYSALLIFFNGSTTLHLLAGGPSVQCPEEHTLYHPAPNGSPREGSLPRPCCTQRWSPRPCPGCRVIEGVSPRALPWVQGGRGKWQMVHTSSVHHCHQTHPSHSLLAPLSPPHPVLPFFPHSTLPHPSPAGLPAPACGRRTNCACGRAFPPESQQCVIQHMARKCLMVLLQQLHPAEHAFHWERGQVGLGR